MSGGERENMYDDLIFDTHAHYDDEAFDADRDELLRGMHENGVGYIVNASADMNDMPAIIELTQKYDFVYGTAGVHPSDVPELNDENLSVIRDMLMREKIVAVGEIGLDYHYPDTDKPLQKEWFSAQIELARREGYPIIVHSRDAAKDTLDIIKAERAREAGGDIHCFSYEKEMAREYLDLGFYVGIGGVLTFKNSRKLKEVADYMPLDRILLETDCPYLAPVPFRGHRNDSAMLKYVVSALAQIKNIDEEEIIRVTTANAKAMYRLDQGSSFSGTEKIRTEFPDR